MTKYPNYVVQSAEPDPSSMIETFRAIGYSMEAAVADILDNSISAGAKNIWVDFEWKGSETWLSIRDDGSGMNSEQLVQAMRPGSKNPTESRHAKDLGRFGLGLKTASFSQCRRLTVLTKTKETQPDYWTWNLDYVRDSGEWNLIKMQPDQPQLDWLTTQTSGTVVVWNELDRLVKNVTEEDEAARSKFLAELKKVKSHLEIVFHRFIGSGKIHIYFQERPLEAWDPFLESNPATQKMPVEPLLNSRVKVKGFILPHKSKFESDRDFNAASGPFGWNAHQGFYIYRNERLLVAGDWFRMFKKEEHYKLARIQIDLPNDLDEEWQIDIKKSIARPPLNLQDKLKAYASNVRARAVEVYRHKGKVLQQKFRSEKFHPIWQEKVRHGKRFYAINRDHPFVMEMLSQMGNPTQSEQLFRFIEETVPVPFITIKESEEPEKHGAAFEGADTGPIKMVMLQMLESMLSKGVSSDEAKSQILSMEPFNQFPHLLDI